MLGTKGQEDFKKRLLDVYTPGDLIANCCTKGNTATSGKALYDLVEVSIHDKRVLPRASTIRKYHPSCWNIPARRDSVWAYKPPRGDNPDEVD